MSTLHPTGVRSRRPRASSRARVASPASWSATETATFSCRVMTSILRYGERSAMVQFDRAMAGHSRVTTERDHPRSTAPSIACRAK